MSSFSKVSVVHTNEMLSVCDRFSVDVVAWTIGENVQKKSMRFQGKRISLDEALKNTKHTNVFSKNRLINIYTCKTKLALS